MEPGLPPRSVRRRRRFTRPSSMRGAAGAIFPPSSKCCAGAKHDGRRAIRHLMGAASEEAGALGAFLLRDENGKLEWGRPPMIMPACCAGPSTRRMSFTMRCGMNSGSLAHAATRRSNRARRSGRSWRSIRAQGSIMPKNLLRDADERLAIIAHRDDGTRREITRRELYGRRVPYGAGACPCRCERRRPRRGHRHP